MFAPIDINTIIEFLPWGLLLAVITYILQKFFVPQILEFKEILKRARYDVLYYANVFPFQSEKNKNILNEKDLNAASKELRVISAKIRSSRDNIPLYPLISMLGIVPKWSATEEIAIGFVGWSNEMFSIEPGQSGRQIFRKKIAKAFGMKEY